jgi:glycosyltransferase involved in cell wall biosynthesis
MKVSGFTIVRNAIKFDYPVIEAIQSVLPLCDEMIVAVGKSQDGTLELIRSVKSDKIKIIESIWDESIREGGKLLAVETDKAFAHISRESDWAFYIQADEVLHEQFLPVVRESMIKWIADKRVDGLLFNYTHFFGSYDYEADSRKWYRKEIRIIRNDPSISSWRDAISFRRGGTRLTVKPVPASIYHYGWVKPPEAQQEKQRSFHKMWHNDKWINTSIPASKEYNYSTIDSLKMFSGTHPAVMTSRIQKKNWTFEHDPSVKNFSVKVRLLHWLEKLTGWRVGEYKNYTIV